MSLDRVLCRNVIVAWTITAPSLCDAKLLRAVARDHRSRSKEYQPPVMLERGVRCGKLVGFVLRLRMRTDRGLCVLAADLLIDESVRDLVPRATLDLTTPRLTEVRVVSKRKALRPPFTTKSLIFSKKAKLGVRP